MARSLALPPRSEAPAQKHDEEAAQKRDNEELNLLFNAPAPGTDFQEPESDSEEPEDGNADFNPEEYEEPRVVPGGEPQKPLKPEELQFPRNEPAKKPKKSKKSKDDDSDFNL